MTSQPKLMDCPHCLGSTTAAKPLCVHCGGYLAMDTVLLAESCQMSVVEGSTINTDSPVVLMAFGCRKDHSHQPTPITIAVRADDVPGLRSALLDRLLTIGVRIQNGRRHHDQTDNSADSR